METLQILTSSFGCYWLLSSCDHLTHSFFHAFMVAEFQCGCVFMSPVSLSLFAYTYSNQPHTCLRFLQGWGTPVARLFWTPETSNTNLYLEGWRKWCHLTHGIKSPYSGTSLAVQWLRLCASNAGGVWVQSLAGELRSHMPHGASKILKKKKKKNLIQKV